MRTKAAVSAIVIAICFVTFHALRRDTHAQPSRDASAEQRTAEQAAVDHGAYLVHHVAMCVQCHTPRDEAGVLDREQLLQGAPMPVDSPYTALRWGFKAPKLAGLPGGWSEQDLIEFLQTGITTTGRTPQPPMPPFRMNERDAAAVAAYLKSLQ